MTRQLFHADHVMRNCMAPCHSIYPSDTVILQTLGCWRMLLKVAVTQMTAYRKNTRRTRHGSTCIDFKRSDGFFGRQQQKRSKWMPVTWSEPKTTTFILFMQREISQRKCQKQMNRTFFASGHFFVRIHFHLLALWFIIFCHLFCRMNNIRLNVPWMQRLVSNKAIWRCF